MDYIQYSFELQPREPWAEILMYRLSEDFAFDGFQENEVGLDAFIPAHLDSEQIVEFLQAWLAENSLEMSFEKSLIPAKNWNEEWESSFEVIKVDDFCSIRAPFHSPSSNTQFDIVILPKMSFGTGHHPTTFSMVKAMRDLNFKGKKVLDMGSGTGVLGILAGKLGASEVSAIDIEEWSVENAKENAKENGVQMEVLLGGKEQIPKKNYDIVLANINRNILMDQAVNYSAVLQSGGSLLLSGFMKEDVEMLLKTFENVGFRLLKEWQKELWICLVLEKI